MQRILFIACWCFGVFPAWSQSIQNLNATFSAGKVIIAYDVVGANPKQTYSLNVFSSHNNFSAPLQNVSGDVGKNVRVGAGKRITWDATAELIDFTGEITFRVKGELVPLPLLVKNPISGNNTRRGKVVTIEWEGGRADENVRFELYKGNDKVLGLGESKNSGRYAWSVPKNFEKGTYSIRFTSGQEVKQSELFTIKPRLPMLVKLLPLLAAGGAAFALAGGGGEKPANELPVAPSPTN